MYIAEVDLCIADLEFKVVLVCMEKVCNEFEHLVHVNPFGTIPKHQNQVTGVITDLSSRSPHDHSVNDGIGNQGVVQLSNTSSDDVVNSTLVLG